MEETRFDLKDIQAFDSKSGYGLKSVQIEDVSHLT